MKSRGFKEKTLKDFKIGCQKKGQKLSITIPHLLGGKAVNIKYRAIHGQEPKWRQEKGATKILFNQDVLKSYTEVILTEGELKTAALHQVGIKNTVALTGGVQSFRPEWVKLFSKVKKIYLVLDSDGAGQSGALQIAKMLGIDRCYNIVLPDAKDPDEYLFDRKNKKEDFQKLLRNAVPFTVNQCFEGLVRADSIKKEFVEFIWDPYIPRAKLILLDGDPGVGKSTLALAVIAKISRGENPWPPTLGIDVETRNAIIFCAEDGAGDTIKPRLEAQNADLENIHIYDGLIKFDEKGLSEIEAMIKACNPCIVLFDTLAHYLGGKVDLYRANEMREPLAKLAEIAKRNYCSIILIRHLNKSSKDQAIYRGLGSIDTAGVARSILLAGRHPSDSSVRILMHIKSNLSKEGKPIQFKLNEGCLEWAGYSELAPNDILYPNKESEQEQLQAAKDFLLRELGFGPVDSKTLKTKAVQEGISERTLERAKSLLGIKSKRISKSKKSSGGHYHWFIEGVEAQVTDGLGVLQ